MVNISALQAEMTEESSSIVIGKEDTSESLKLMGLTKEDLGVNINSISFSPDGNLLAAATQDGNVNIINASEYEQVVSIRNLRAASVVHASNYSPWHVLL